MIFSRANTDMKKPILILGCILAVLTALPPLGGLIASCFGYKFVLASVTAFTAVNALLSVCLVVLSARQISRYRVLGGIFALLAPLSVVNAGYLIRKETTVWVALFVLVCVGCSLFLVTKHSYTKSLKVATLMGSSLLILAIGYSLFFTLPLGYTSQNAVVFSTKSPSGTYYAEIVDVYTGKLRGSTVVDVYESDGINALIFRTYKNTKSFSLGGLRSINNMKIYWKSDNRLVINSAEYNVD